MRLTRFVFASLLLLVLAAPYWPHNVDDVYIALGYAREWLQSGELRWTSGERVEGYSNFLWVAALRGLLPLAGDGAVLAKSMALAASLCLLGLASRVIPRTAQGTALLFAMVCWAPLARWSVDGMETPFYALLLTGGWLAVAAGPWGLGMWLLAAAALTRPEGVGVLAIGTFLGRRSSGADRTLGNAALVGLAVYHAVRVTWFGELLPTPLLVKVSPVPLTLYGWRQAAGELVTAAGILIGMPCVARTRWKTASLALVPLLFQAAVLGRASGDWMVNARLLLPGVLASAVAWAVLGEARPSAKTPALLIGALGLFAGWFMPVGYGAAKWEPRAWGSISAYRRGLDTPLAEDVVWAVEEVPTGDTLFVADVGMLGNIPGIRVLDMRGLVQRQIAEAIAGGPEAEVEGLRTFVHSPERPSFIRLAAWGGSTPELPVWVAPAYTLRAEFGYSGGTTRWYALHDHKPPASEVLERWRTLHTSYPAQPLVTWHYALALADAGRLGEAIEVAAGAASDWPPLREAPESLSFPSGPRPMDWSAGRGLGLYWNAAARSGPIPAGNLPNVRLRLDVDDPGPEGAAVRVSVEGACGSSVEERTIRERQELPLRAPDCAAASDPLRVSVAFLNDSSEHGDRNVYVALTSAR